MVVSVLHGDSLKLMATLPADSVDAVVTDPPYHLTTGKKGGSGQASLNLNSPAGRARPATGFMGKAWDGGDVAFRPETWAAVSRVMKPGAHLSAFGGTRTFHRLACAIEDSGLEIRDTLCWLFGQGFPKHANALKPGYEPIILARKLPEGSVASNVLAHGCGGLNIDACRIGDFINQTPSGMDRYNAALAEQGYRPNAYRQGTPPVPNKVGRWPANVIHDGSDEVMEAFAAFGNKGGNGRYRLTGNNEGARADESQYRIKPIQGTIRDHGDTGTAARFFYCAKTSQAERDGSKHPTIKPLALMTWLASLTCPPGGTVLDPFAGTGTTLQAADRLGMNAIGIELDAASVADIHNRLAGRRTAAER